MKICLAITAALCMLAAFPSNAQPAIVGSDTYLCAHGDQGDYRTIQACDRKDIAAAQAAGEPGFGAPLTAPSPQQLGTQAIAGRTVSPAFRQGQADRQRWEIWIGSQSGDYLAGAAYWASVRSLARHPSCGGPGSPMVSADWLNGCVAAQHELGGSDVLRGLSSDYRLGWNSPMPGTPAATALMSEVGKQRSGVAGANPPPEAEATSPSVSAPEGIGQEARNDSDGAVERPHDTLSSVTAPSPQLQPSSPPSRDNRINPIELALIVVAGLYFAPTLIATLRRKRNGLAIFALNLLLGWTVVGWVASFVWSLMVEGPRPKIFGSVGQELAAKMKGAHQDF